MSEEAFDAPAALAPAELPASAIEPQNIARLRWATAAYHSAATDDPASTTWYPRLLADVEVGVRASDALGIGGRLGLGVSEIALDDADGALQDLDRWGVADGRMAELRVVPVVEPNASDFGTPLAGRVVSISLDLMTLEAREVRSDPVLAFRGVVRAVDRLRFRRASITLADVTERLALPLQPALYAGTGGTEGGTELKGAPKPVTLGRCYNLAPVYLGNLDLGAGIGSLPTFHVHWRGVEEIAAVRIRGVVQTLTGGTPTVGQARAFPALGMFQLGSTPDGEVRCDVRGDNAGGYVSSVAGVLRRMVQSLGPALGDGDLDASAWAFAEADLPGEVGVHVPPVPVTASDAAEVLLGAAGAVMCGGRAGALRLFDPIAQEGGDQFDLPEPWILDCRPVPLPAALRPLPSAVEVAWRRNWAPITDVAGSVTTDERERMQRFASGPARVSSQVVTARVAIQRTLSFPGIYWAEADAQARAEKWRAWIEAGPRMFELVTDRYLGQVDCGAIGRITYPAWGIEGGARVVVLAWSEALAAQRLSLIVATLPEA